MNYSTEPYHKQIDKPWGKEIILTPEGSDRVGKLLFVNAGSKLSFQYHDKKEETLCLVSGDAEIWLEDSNGEIQKLPMTLQSGYAIHVGQKHRIIATTDCIIAEVSSPEEGITVRINDDYNRPDETDDMRQAPNRGWSGQQQ